MTASLRICIPSLPPAEFSANNSRGRAWYAKAKAASGKRGAYDLIIALVHEQGWNKEPLTKAVVTVAFGLPDRRKRLIYSAKLVGNWLFAKDMFSRPGGFGNNL